MEIDLIKGPVKPQSTQEKPPAPKKGPHPKGGFTAIMARKNAERPAEKGQPHRTPPRMPLDLQPKPKSAVLAHKGPKSGPKPKTDSKEHTPLLAQAFVPQPPIEAAAKAKSHNKTSSKTIGGLRRASPTSAKLKLAQTPPPSPHLAAATGPKPAPEKAMQKQAISTTARPALAPHAQTKATLAKPALPKNDGHHPLKSPREQQSLQALSSQLTAPKGLPKTAAQAKPRPEKTAAPASPQNAKAPRLVRIARPIASMQKKPKQIAPGSSAPLQHIEQTNPAPDMPANMPFDLKITAPPLSMAHMTQPQAAPPLTSQISEQLPQLLTKETKQSIELRLDPPELGRVTIHLTTHDQQVTAHIIADRGDTADLMRRHADVLTATLARAGFSQANLSFQQGHRQGHQGSFQHVQFAPEVSESPQPASPPPRLEIEGQLDIRL